MGIEVEAKVEVDAAVGAAALKRSKAAQILSIMPRIAVVPGNYVGSGTTYGFLAFPQVTPGKIWEVLRIGVTPTDIFTTLAGVVVVAVRTSTVPQDTSSEPASFGDVVAPSGQVPNTTYPGRYGVMVRSNERIVLALRGVSAGAQLAASMDIIEHDMMAFLRNIDEVD